MSSVVDLFTRKSIDTTSPADLQVVDNTGDENTFLFDPRGMWENYVNKGHMRQPEHELLQHEVTHSEIARAVGFSQILCKDEEAAAYFLSTLNYMTGAQQPTTVLASIPPQFRGYVWGPNAKDFLKAVQYYEYHLPTIIGKAITRHIYME